MLGGTKVVSWIGGRQVEATIERTAGGWVRIESDGWAVAMVIDATAARRLAEFFTDHADRLTGQKGGG